MPPSLPVVILGAGPYGLSVAAHLRARGINFRIFGRPLDAWRSQMPAGMFLKSEWFASNLHDPAGLLTLAAYCAQHGIEQHGPIPLETFTSYGLWFQRQLVPEVEETEVLELRKDRNVFELRLATGERLSAARVVVAVGTSHFSYLPPCLTGLPDSLVTHTSAHRELTAFAGKEVVVIGSGQSALETAALLHEQRARVRLVVRKAYVSFHPPPVPGHRGIPVRIPAPRAGLGGGWVNWLFEQAPLGFRALPASIRVRLIRSILGPCGAWWLKERVLGRVPMITGCNLAAVTPDRGGIRLRLLLSDGEASEIKAQHVIAGTGFRVELRRLPFLDASLVSRLRNLGGAPALSTYFESSIPGLYFVGLAAAYHFGPPSRFVLGARFAARQVARHIGAPTLFGGAVRSWSARNVG